MGVQDFPHTLFCATDELIDRGNTVVWHVVVVCHGVESRAWTSLVGGTRSNEGVVTGVAHVLRRSVKRRNDSRKLPPLIRSGSFCLLSQMLHDAWVGIGKAGNGQSGERSGGLHVGSIRDVKSVSWEDALGT